MIKTYYLLTKPGIILGNLLTVVAGFALATQAFFDYTLFLITLFGLGGVIACACVFNNYIDRFLDQKMERTQHRAFAQKAISVPKALVFAIFLGLAGITLLLLFTNLLTVCMATIGFFVYVVLYSLGKSRTLYATFIGSISGAMPPLVGYCAVSNHFDTGALFLFLILVLWQMPHFFSIAIYRFNDYLNASIPVLPVKKGMVRTKVHILFYIIAFIIACVMLTLFDYTGYLYLTLATLLGGAWLWLSLKGFKSKNHTLWARQMFICSLVVITALCILIPLDRA